MPVNVLLVDDQPSRRLTYRAVLEPLGEHLVEAESGEEALRMLMEQDFAVILLDVNMPGMDGFETAEMIHQHPRFENTPIIFVTAVNVDDMDRLRGYTLGAVDYVTVPVIPDILRGKVMVLCELYRKRRELQQANEQLAAANVALEAQNVAERERLNASLQAANRALEQRNRALQAEVEERARAEQRLIEMDHRKDAFLAMLAHELRNPLAPLQNALAIQRLEGRTDDALQGMMERQLLQLVRLIDDLLDVARVSRGKIALQPRPTTIDQILRVAVDTAQPLIDTGGHRLHLDVPQWPQPVLADPERLAQVFANLLNNAAKYSHPGSDITLQASQSEEAIEVSVRDTGMGLNETDIERVFDLFEQLDRGADHAQGGLGVGLALVRELVAMHGGQVRAHSEGPGKGSEFRVRLPVVKAEAGPVEAAVAPAPRHAPRKVLVVDDNRDAADSLGMMVRMLGHEVECLYDPDDVMARVSETRPELLFLDIGMPGMDGRELATRLRALPGGDVLTLVAVSGWGQPHDIQRSHEAGFDRHLVKPPRPDAISAICAARGSRPA